MGKGARALSITWMPGVGIDTIAMQSRVHLLSVSPVWVSSLGYDGGEVVLWLVLECLMPVLRELSCMLLVVEQRVLGLLHVTAVASCVVCCWR